VAPRENRHQGLLRDGLRASDKLLINRAGDEETARLDLFQCGGADSGDVGKGQHGAEKALPCT
jgi:hypothetical protein